jgi:hypothetical protein
MNRVVKNKTACLKDKNELDAHPSQFTLHTQLFGTMPHVMKNLASSYSKTDHEAHRDVRGRGSHNY